MRGRGLGTKKLIPTLSIPQPPHVSLSTFQKKCKLFETNIIAFFLLQFRTLPEQY